MEYGSNVTVSFEGDGTSYNVTVYDENDKMVFSQVTNQTSVNIAGLDIGEYNVIVVNLGSTNQSQSSASTVFRVFKDNHVEVFAQDSDYGREVYIGIAADVDGNYTVDLNGTEVTIEVIDGEGIFYGLLDLNAGNYSTKVIFDDHGYNTL